MSCDLDYGELAARTADELTPERAREIDTHVVACPRCRRLLALLDAADAQLAALPRMQPSADALLTTRRALSEITRGGHAPEIMTLEEVAEYLRMDADTLGEIAEELPAFELAGQVRVRRTQLVEWIEQRERDYMRATSASWAAQVHLSVA